MNNLKLLALAALAVTTTAAAQSKISAQSIIVNPAKPPLSVSVNVDKDDSGNQNPVYRVGDEIKISASVNQDAYVYLFNINPDGSVQQILPNRLSKDNFVKANETTVFPAEGADFKFNVADVLGQNKLLAVASTKRLDLAQLSQFKNAQTQFATVSTKGQDKFAQALSIIVNPLPSESWVTGTAFYAVESVKPVATGNLFVGTNVSGSTVIMKGKFMGGANQTFTSLRPGVYPVRVKAPGFADFTTTLTIKANTTTNLNVQFYKQ